MRRSALWSIVLVAVAPLAARAMVVRVPSQYPTIQKAVDAVAAGDSVLVAPGTYSDTETRVVGGITRAACVFLKGGVRIISEAGAGATAIDMQNASGLSFPRLLYGVYLGLPETVIDGFTMTGVRFGNTAVEIGGAGKVVFRDCRLHDLDSGATEPGGIFAVETDLDLIDCSFERCAGYGVSAVHHGRADLYVSNCTFADCRGTALYADGESPNSDRTVIEDCTFRDNLNQAGGGYYAGLAVGRRDGGCQVRRCVFKNNVCTGPGAGAAIDVLGLGAVVEDSIFWDNRSLASWGGGLEMALGEVRGCTFSGNTGVFAGCAVVVGAGIPITTQFHNNVVANSSGGAALRATNGVTLIGGCNVFWNNANGDAQNYTFAPTDRVVDPQFCGADVGDLTVNAASPCLPPNSGGCGLIGAEEQGCGSVSVEPNSWGKIKGTYREGGAR